MRKYENKVVIRGNAESEPSVNANVTAASFYLFTNHYHTDRNGKKHKKTERHRIVAFGKMAKLAEELVVKGALIEVEGASTSRMRTDVEQPHPVHEIRVSSIKEVILEPHGSVDENTEYQEAEEQD